MGIVEKERIKKFLLTNKGYLKKGPGIISQRCNCTMDLAKLVLQEIRRENKVLDKQVEIASYIKPKELNKIQTSTIDKPGVYWVTGCAHSPWQNKSMYESTYNYLNKEVDLSGIILAGDIVDLNSLSSHDRGKTPIQGVTLDWEYKEANKFLNEIDSITSKNITKDYLYGNHEDRYLRTKSNVDIAKYGDALISPENGLNLQKRGYNLYNDWKNSSVQIGRHLDICHGEFFNVHSAKKTIDTYRKSTLYFHTHRFQIYMEGLVAGWNMGCGLDINAPIFKYATRAMKNSWVNSSCLVTLDSNGYYHVQPLLFIKNKLIVNGRCY